MSAAVEPDHDAPGLPDFLRDPVGCVRRRWLWMLVAAAASLALLVAAVFVLIKPKYRATATVLVNSQQIPEEFVQTTVQEDSFEKINALVGRVLARERLAELVEKHHLYASLLESTPLQDVLERFRDAVVIEEDHGVGRQARQVTSRLFTISYANADPEVAAAVTNDLADSLTEASIHMRQEKAALTTQFLRKQLAAAEVELREQESKITDFKERYRGELPAELESNLRKLERLQAQRQSLALQIAEAETRLAMVASGETVPADGTPQSRLADLRSRYQEELAVNTELHPNVLSLKRQIEALEAQYPELASGSPQGVAATTDRTLQELRKQLADTERTISDLDGRVANTNQRAEDLAALEQKAEVLRANHLEFLNKVKEAELAENLESAQQGEHVSVLDRATPPTSPERARPMFVAFAVLMSLLAGIAVGLLLEIVDPVVTSAAQVEERLHLPVLGSVPRIVAPASSHGA